MNERIKELFEQSKKADWSQYNPSYDYEKFAQLLIEKFAYGLMDLHGSSPEHIVYAAKLYGVEL
jgi:hypothetical protein